MALSEIKLALIAQAISHLGASVEPYDVFIPDPSIPTIEELTEDQLVAIFERSQERGTFLPASEEDALELLRQSEGKPQRKPNPDNSYAIQYGNKWFQTQYGDAGYCADYHIHGLNILYEQAGLESPIPMKTGLGYGSAKFLELAKSLEANVEFDIDNFTPGNIVIGSYEDPNLTKFSGHVFMVLSVEPDYGGEEFFGVRVFEANMPYDFDTVFENEDDRPTTNVVTHYFVNKETGDLWHAGDNWDVEQVHDVYMNEIDEDGKGNPLSLRGIINPDLLPASEELEKFYSQYKFNPEPPDSGYISEPLRNRLLQSMYRALDGDDVIPMHPDNRPRHNPHP